MSSADVIVENHGSLWLLRLATRAARHWVEEHVCAKRQEWCGALVVEPRYLEALLAGMLEDGLVVR